MEYEILEYLKSCATVVQNPTVPYLQFVEFLFKQAEASKNNLLQHMAHSHKERLTPILESLVNKKECILIKDAVGIKAIFIFQAAINIILKKYEQLEYGYTAVFPSLEQLEFKLPQDSVTIVNIKEDFVKLISSPESATTPIIKILFPLKIDNITIPRSIINTKLMKYSILIIKNFFQGQMNIEFVYNKFVSLFKGNEIALSDLLKLMITKPNSALESLLKPTNFSFKFWTYIANLVLENLKDKSGILAKEHSYCQAAYLIGYYIVYQKGIIQKEKQKKMDLDKISTRLKKPPYVYTLKDIYSFVDKSGVPFIKKYSKKLINDYIEKLSDVKDDINTLPHIVTLGTGTNNELYILKESIIPMFMEKVDVVSNKVKSDVIELWSYYCMNFIKDKSMYYDFAFLIDLEKRVKREFPIFYLLLTNNLALMAVNDPEIPETIQRLLHRFLTDKHKLYELDMLLDMDRVTLLQEVKSKIPIYYSLPIISIFIHLIKLVFGKKGRKPSKYAKMEMELEKKAREKKIERENTVSDESGGNHVTSNTRKPLSQAEYNSIMTALKKEILGNEKSIENSLRILAEKWNPLIDPDSKANLHEDVNSLIRDFIRSLRKGFRTNPPDARRIKNLAKELSQKDVLQKIKQKEYLIRYIELYIIKNLMLNTMR